MHKTFIIGSIFNVPLHTKNCLSGPFKMHSLVEITAPLLVTSLNNLEALNGQQMWVYSSLKVGNSGSNTDALFAPLTFL